MPMNMQEIERTLKYLRLPGMRSTLDTRSLQVAQGNLSFMDGFSLLLQDEMDRRHSKLIERRYALSGLTEKKTFEDFEWRYNPKIPKNECFELLTGKFITEHEDAILIGRRGRGRVTSQKRLRGARSFVGTASFIAKRMYCLGIS